MHFSVSKQSSALHCRVSQNIRKIFCQQPDKISFAARSTHLALAHNSLAAGVPVPQQHGAVLAAADDVAVAGVVTLRPGDKEKRIL